jgi:putative toxin-antitoxin system antitoxin component (TIGR02293 family)
LNLPLDDLVSKLSISRATLHRRKNGGRLSPDESDKVVRFSRLLEHAANVFGSVEKGQVWLKFPQYGLGGAVPLEYAKTEIGAREVHNLLGRIDYDVYS